MPPSTHITTCIHTSNRMAKGMYVQKRPVLMQPQFIAHVKANQTFIMRTQNNQRDEENNDENQGE